MVEQVDTADLKSANRKGCAGSTPASGTKENEVNRDDVIRMAGHREVPPWVMKLVMDCVEAERERMRWDSVHTCGPTCDNATCVAVREAVEAEREGCACEAEGIAIALHGYDKHGYAEAIRARGEQ